MVWHQALSKIEILIAIKKKLMICLQKIDNGFLGSERG